MTMITIMMMMMIIMMRMMTRITMKMMMTMMMMMMMMMTMMTMMIVFDKMMMMYSPCTRLCRWLSENGRQRCISARPMLKNVNLSNLNVRSLIYHQVKSHFIFQCEFIEQYIYGYGKKNLLKI